MSVAEEVPSRDQSLRTLRTSCPGRVTAHIEVMLTVDANLHEFIIRAGTTTTARAQGREGHQPREDAACKMSTEAMGMKEKGTSVMAVALLVVAPTRVKMSFIYGIGGLTKMLGSNDAWANAAARKSVPLNDKKRSVRRPRQVLPGLQHDTSICPIDTDEQRGGKCKLCMEHSE